MVLAQLKVISCRVFMPHRMKHHVGEKVDPQKERGIQMIIIWHSTDVGAVHVGRES